MNDFKVSIILLAVFFIAIPAFSQAGEYRYDAADLIKIYTLENELYQVRLKAEKKMQLRKLITKEAAAAGITADEWEKRFFENNEPALPPELAEKLSQESEQTKKTFHAAYRARLKEKLWDELSQKYRMRINLVPPRPPVIPVQAMDARSAGDKNKAVIRIAEFFDIECPHCREASAIYARIREEFSGAIYWSAYNFPAETTHRAALDAHLAAECAGDQGRFFEFREILFSAPKLSPAVFRDAARKIHLDEKSFEKCFIENRPAFVEKIRTQSDYAKELGIPGTPTLIINGRPYPGVRSYAELKRILVRLAAGKKN